MQSRSSTCTHDGLLEFHIKLCVPKVILPNRWCISSPVHGSLKLSHVVTVADKGSSTGNSMYNDLRASPYKNAVLTSASMKDLLAIDLHPVNALDIIVHMIIKPGVPANNSPSLPLISNVKFLVPPDVPWR